MVVTYGTELQFLPLHLPWTGKSITGKFFLYSSFFTAIKGKIHEEKLIAYDHFDVM